MTVTVQLDLTEFNAAAAAALGDTVDEYLDEVDALFTSDVWAWPGTTKRQNGAIAGSPRDVVDAGKLAGSREVNFSTGGLGVTVEWTAAHAAAVFLGAVFRKRALSLPARNVPAAALERLDVGATYSRALARRLR